MSHKSITIHSPFGPDLFFPLKMPINFGPFLIVIVGIDASITFSLVHEAVKMPFGILANPETLELLKIAFLEPVPDIIFILVMVVKRYINAAPFRPVSAFLTLSALDAV